MKILFGNFESFQESRKSICALRRVFVLIWINSMLAAGGDISVHAQTHEGSNGETVTFVHSKEDQSLDIFIHGEYFTSYRYEDTWKKPVFYPLQTTSGISLTRGFPINPEAGERFDHQHHVGYWFNYGDVNGLDFWNNSDARPAEKRDRYGEVRHHALSAFESIGEKGRFKTYSDWISPSGEVLLEEQSIFTIQQSGNTRIIDRWTQLTAQQAVHFEDSKEGMVAVRVTKELELPNPKPIGVLGSDLMPNTDKKVDTLYRRGDYLSSEGVRGKSVWGTRAIWMQLSGEKMGKEVSLVIIDHPDNVGYPTYWHARDYGLFAANPLGQKVFSKGDRTLDFSLQPNESEVFQYRVLVHEGADLRPEEINKLAKTFSGRK